MRTVKEKREFLHSLYSGRVTIQSHLPPVVHLVYTDELDAVTTYREDGTVITSDEMQAMEEQVKPRRTIWINIVDVGHTNQRIFPNYQTK